MADKYNPKFLKYIEEFMNLGEGSHLFPKKCRTCGQVYNSFPEYIHLTQPVAHGLEPYKDSVDAFHTMQYRNCRCGSTLCIDFTEEHYPLLESFWEMLGKDSKERNKPLRDVVLEFREQCNRYIADKKSDNEDT
jgi:hypothetical protein